MLTVERVIFSTVGAVISSNKSCATSMMNPKRLAKSYCRRVHHRSIGIEEKSAWWSTTTCGAQYYFHDSINEDTTGSVTLIKQFARVYSLQKSWTLEANTSQID